MDETDRLKSRKLNTNSSEKPRAIPKLASRIIESCVEAKALDIKLLDVSQVFSLSSYFVVMSGRSDRHVQGICNRIQHDLGEAKVKPIALEGYDKGHWVLLDYGDVIVHIFYESTREHYDLESLWVTAESVDISDQLRGLPSDREAA